MHPAERIPAAKEKLLQKILQSRGAPPIPIALWNGEVLFAEQSSAPGRVAIRDRMALLRLLLHPDLEYGRLYAAGRLDVEGDLVACLEALYRSASRPRHRALIQPALTRLRRLYQHGRSRSRHNVYHHYDIGNDFYRLWLDRQLLYTCAYFPDPAMSLEDAQIAKMDHVCRKLRLQPGEEVVEAGCGWGALALHMARHYGVKVRAYNLSHQQIAYARRWAQDEGLDDRVTFIEGDYREISGRYDVFVSVGMLEHVGPDHYGAFGRLIDATLKDTGRGLVHSIGRNVPEPFNPWVERYIFPGAYPPTLGEMARVFEAGGFSVLDVENLRLHYARTLEHWLSRYESVFDRAAQMYDLPFARAWRLYLAGSTAAFRTGYLQLFQVSFTRGDDNDIPWTRDYLYRD